MTEKPQEKPEEESREESKEEELQEESQEESQEEEEKEPEEEEESDKELEAKRKAYKERQEKRKREEEQERLRWQADQAEQEDETAYLKKIAKRIEHEDMVKTAKRELGSLEKEFIEAYPDYKEKVNTAIEFAKMNLMKKGYSEAEALEQVEYEKVMLADSAARQKKDPVQAIYEEANNISSLIDEFAELKGYKKTDGKTSLQKQREISKPNAMQGGRGTKAVRKDLMDRDNDELNNMTLGDMLAAKNAGAL